MLTISPAYHNTDGIWLRYYLAWRHKNAKIISYYYISQRKKDYFIYVCVCLNLGFVERMKIMRMEKKLDVGKINTIFSF